MSFLNIQMYFSFKICESVDLTKLGGHKVEYWVCTVCGRRWWRALPYDVSKLVSMGKTHFSTMLERAGR